ncbi:YadA-like family protein [Sphingomonas sp. 1P08PE]|uniref:YadA-like family protein n=1 Tax=Sphingomonas sp. 1P08PE TaxID=554122 RepID=UPI00399F464C
MYRGVIKSYSAAARPLLNTTCAAAIVAGVAVFQPTAASAQLLTLNGLATDLGVLSTKVDQQGATISGTTTLANTLNTNLNTLTTTVTNQGNALQTVQTTAANTANNLATVTGTVNQQQIAINAATGTLGTVTTGLNNLTSTVGLQANALQSLQTTVSGNVADLAQVSAAVNQQGAQINLNLGALNTLNNSFTTLAGTVNGQANTLQTLQTSVAGAAADVGSLAGAVADLTTDVASSSARILANTADINDLQASVGANVGDITALQASIGTANADLADVQTILTDHDVRISANASDIGSIGATVSVQGSTLAQQGGDLATAAANIASLQSLVNLQAGTLGTLGTTVTAQGSLLSQQDTRITANADAILSLRNMAVSGNASPVQYTLPNAPLVATTTATNDVAILGGQPGPVRVHNVAEGDVAVGSTDAVNGGQLYDVSQQIGVLAAAAVQYDDASHTRVSLGGINSQPVVMANVARGSVSAGSDEAINGSQLAETNAVVNDLGAALTGQAGDLVQARTDITTLGTTVTAQASLLTATGDSVATLRRDTENGAIGPVRYSTPSTPLVPNGGTLTNSLVLVGRDPQPVSLHNVAEGSVSGGSTDAVNGGQLFALATSFQGLADLAIQYDDSSEASVTLGNAGVPVALRNVAAGTLAAGSTDAATAGQLFATNQNLNTLGGLVSDQATTIAGLDSRIAVNAGDLAAFRANVVSGAVGPVQYANPASPGMPNGGTVTQDLTLVGAAAGPVRLHNVAAGIVAMNSADAANGGQIFSLASATANLFGSGFSYNALTGFSGTFNFKGANYNSIQSVFGAIATSLGSANSGSGGGVPNPDGAKYFHANSTMADSDASGFDSTAIGPASTSSGVAAIAVGRNAVAEGDSSVAIGDGAQAMNGKAVSIGLGNVASGNGAVAIGDPNFATGEGATALGKDNTATGVGAIALGNVNVALGDGSTSIGSMNRAEGLGAAALGYTNVADGQGAIAIGANNFAVGDGALAIGANVTTSANDTLAIGNSAQATGLRAVAIGNSAVAAATNSSTFGYDASADSGYSTAIGTSGRATGFGSTALGALSSASAYASTALGSGAVADQAGSVALGSAAQTVRGAVASYSAFGLADAQQSLGEIAIARNISYLDPVTGVSSPVGNRQITGLAAGFAATDAVNVSQLRGVANGLGNALAIGFGGGSQYNPLTGAVSAPSYTLNGVTYSNVGDALQAIATQGSGSPAGGNSPQPGNGTPAAGNAAQGSPEPTTAIDNAQLAATTDRVSSIEGRVATVETKADQALAESSRSVQYDAGNDSAVTLGSGSSAVALHNVASGVADTDAVNLGQVNSALAGAVAEANGYTDQRVAAISFDVRRVNRDASAGVAGAMAMAGMPQPFEAGKSMFAMGAGTFQGQSAVAVGMSRIMNDGHTVVKLGATYNSRKRVGANIGIGYQF